MFTIYGNSLCFYCKQAVEFCDEKMLDYEYKNIDNDYYMNEFKTKMVELGISHKVTIPQIFVTITKGTFHIGGYDDLVEFYNGMEEDHPGN
jgi:glutaredoxin